VARNRKRAKERRARRSDGAVSRQRIAAAGADAAANPRVATPDPDAAPSPIEHAAPDVELADAQIALAASDQAVPLDRAEVRREEELLEEEFEEERQEQDAAAAAVVTHERASLPARLAGFLQGSWRELQRVQWPDRRQVAQATGVVIGFVIVAGVFLGVADLVASKLVNFVLK
jgi:preprotein translocase SecE subunit